MMLCPRCGCVMYKAMKGCGPQQWVCSVPTCGTVVKEEASV